jgi:methylthioribose-1-phosphate isomerase
MNRTAKPDIPTSVRPIQWTGEKLRLLDQRRLPGETVYLDLDLADSTVDAIQEMVVRGAPAIGTTGAFAVVLAARARFAADPHNWREAIQADLEHIGAARPTAVNLGWAVRRMAALIDRLGDENPVSALVAEAQRIHEQTVDADLRMGELGAALIKPGSGVLTHCNTGALATGGIGTALGVVRTAHAMGRVQQVFADETRPWLQGSRLTAWELVQEHIPVTLIADGAGAYLMKTGRVQWVIVGADRIAANGDVANKIGTYSAAVAARYHGVRFMVVAPVSTIDPATPDGGKIPIETRPESEVLSLGGQSIAPVGAHAWNPAFDVTPAELVDVIVTERGVVERPDREGITRLLEG